jgi:hypothetical protein
MKNAIKVGIVSSVTFFLTTLMIKIFDFNASIGIGMGTGVLIIFLISEKRRHSLNNK